MRTVTATRYLEPLRRGGSLPAIVEADDDGTYVLKFRGAGQGGRALAAEVIAGELARAFDLPVPELVLVDVAADFGRPDEDPEIDALTRASEGVNLGVDYLPGATTFDPHRDAPPDGALASALVWFDALITNVDRTATNPNLLVWHRRLWAIDHGAALYVHHGWRDPAGHARDPFPAIREHVLLPWADRVAEVAAALAARLDGDALHAAVAAVPDAWLPPDAAAERRAYVDYLAARVAAVDGFTATAVAAAVSRAATAR